MAQNPVIREILQKYTRIWALGHATNVLDWDLETHMPEGGARPRGLASGQLQMMTQSATVELDRLVRKAERAKNLNDMEKGTVRLLRRSLDYYLKIPADMVNEIKKVAAEATVVWRKARKKSDFRLYRPHLEKIVELKRQVAERLGYEGHPYDALLDLFEEGFTVRDADSVYSKLLPGSKKLLARVSSAGVFPPKHPLESAAYDVRALERVNDEVLGLLQMPKERFRMDVSTHPFTTKISPDDVRITTRYEGTDFRASVYGTIHESGHAIYDLGVDPKLAYTPVADGASYAFHESQSRFWENVVGRSREFVALLGPILRKNLSLVGGYDDEQLYLYFNTVRRSLIRVEADELTYNFHTAIRYAIEKRIIAGEVRVSEVPEIWNDTFEEYLGIRPKSDADGALQDVHWSDGSFGYFATYTLGNIIAAMIWHKLGDGKLVQEALEEGDILLLKRWLGQKIHRYGAIYPPKELQKKVFGESYNPDRLSRYLSAKFDG